MVEDDPHTLSLFDARVEDKGHQKMGAGIGRATGAERLGDGQHPFHLRVGEDAGERGEDGAVDDGSGRVLIQYAGLGQPPEKDLEGGDAAGEGFGAARHASFVDKPVPKVPQVLRPYLTDGGPDAEVLSEYLEVGYKGLDGVRAKVPLFHIGLEGGDGGTEG